MTTNSATTPPETRARFPLEIPASTEQLVVAASLYWTLSANGPFFSAALSGYSVRDPASWGFTAVMFLLVFSIHAMGLSLIVQRWSAKPVIAVLTVATAFAGYYMREYGVYLDPTMVRNVLHTDLHEASELLNHRLPLHLALYAGLPLFVLWHVRLTRQPMLRAIGRRLLMLAALLALVAGGLYATFQPLASLMRNHKEVRYLITPANYLWSTAVVARGDARDRSSPREPVGEDAMPGPSWATRQKPMVLLMVVGETARAANWGLSGYARQTTPQLAQLQNGPQPLVNFMQVTACGTSTEVSLPCMFSAIGRRDYDESRIRRQESLLKVVARAGVHVQWRDNQSGCKGVCDGLPNDQVTEANAHGLCNDEGRCLDEGLVADLDQRLTSARGTSVWVMHMLGNHGPSYFRRYPRSFARFQPDCRNDDLRHCSVAEVTNAYDNALLYTDHVLASAIAKLRAHADTVDSALIYVSDHGESLGDNGLFLHGVPYGMAPDVQKQVPMVMWSSAGFEQGAGLPAGCLQAELTQRASQPASHDNLFHTVLGLLDVQTKVHDPAWDLAGRCRAETHASR